MNIILLVLNNPDALEELLDAWQNAGVTGLTILESTGLHRSQAHFIPMRYAPSTFSIEKGNLTLMAIVEDEALVQACLQASEQVIGDLNKPNTGIFTSWTVDTAKGLHKKDP